MTEYEVYELTTAAVTFFAVCWVVRAISRIMH